MVKKIPKKLIKKRIPKYSVKSYDPKKYLNVYIPKELRKYFKGQNDNSFKLNTKKVLGSSKSVKNGKTLNEKDILRNEKVRYSEKIINQIHSGLGANGSSSNIIKDALNLKPTNTKAGIERLEKIARKLKNGDFNIKRYLGKNKVYKDMKELYNFKIINNMVRVFDKDIKQEEEFSELWKKTGSNLDVKWETGIIYENMNFMDFIKFIFKSEKEREFYEQNKDFFRIWGGGTHANRANPMYVSLVRELRGRFNSDYTEKKYADILGPYKKN